MSTFSLRLPDLGEDRTEVEIVAWRVRPGDTVIEDQVIADLVTGETAVELRAPVTGRVLSLLGSTNESVAVGTEVIVFETAEVSSTARTATSAAELSDSATAPAETASPDETLRSLTSPSIRRLARDAGIDLTGIHGSGPEGKIRREDLEPHLQPQDQLPATDKPSQPTPPVTQTGVEAIEVVGLRQATAQRMTEVHREIPHFSFVEEIDVTDLENICQQLNNKYAAARGQLTHLPFIILGLVRALTDHPQCNAVYDKDRQVLLQHSAVHIGLATHTDAGLKIPVLHDAQRSSLWQLANQAATITQAARDGSATPSQLTGSTITLTSLGKLGGIVTTPIINPPEVAIVEINRVVERPMVSNGHITARRMMNVSSSFDHRFVDSHTAAALIHRLKDLLEYPRALFPERKTNGPSAN